jgi:hypothetical protein
LIIAGIAQPDAIGEVDLAIRAKIRAGFSGGSVEGDEAGVQSANENSQRAGCGGFSGGRVPCGHATRSDFRGAIGEFEFGIELPKFFAGDGVQRNDVIVGSAEVEFSVDEDRSGFESGFVIEVCVVREGSGAKSPSDFELRDIIAVNLLGGRITSATRIVAVGGPTRVWRSGFRLRRRVRGKQQEEKEKREGLSEAERG